MKKFLISTVALLAVCMTVEAGPLARLFGRGQPSRTYQSQQVQQQEVRASVVQTPQSTQVQVSYTVCEDGQCRVVTAPMQAPVSWAAPPAPMAYQTVRYAQQQPTYPQPVQFTGGTVCVTGR